MQFPSYCFTFAFAMMEVIVKNGRGCNEAALTVIHIEVVVVGSAIDLFHRP